MLAFLDGKIEYVEDNTIAVNVGGVGYEVYATSSAVAKFSGESGAVRLYTYLQAKEDGVTLFGFSGREEKTMFLKLITVSGVGAKTAVGILSSVKPADLAVAIATGDSQALSKVKGIGKKTAERIILELKEQVSGFASEALPSVSFSTTESDAAEALMALGLSRAESVKAVNSALEAGKNTAEEIIGFALKSLG